MKLVQKCSAMLLVVWGGLASANAIDLSQNLGTKDAGPISHTFTIDNAKIATWEVDNIGVWEWNREYEAGKFSGTVYANSDASGEHAGKFHGTYESNTPSTDNKTPGGEETSNTWTGTLTGKGKESARKVSITKLTFNDSHSVSAVCEANEPAILTVKLECIQEENGKKIAYQLKKDTSETETKVMMITFNRLGGFFVTNLLYGTYRVSGAAKFSNPNEELIAIPMRKYYGEDHWKKNNE